MLGWGPVAIWLPTLMLAIEVAVFPADALFLIAGPCVAESDDLNLRVGEHLARLAERVPGGIIYKASFDKANRSNAGAARGLGLDEGLAALQRVARATGLPILTDVHLPEQCAVAAEVVDVLQIPAFLCRQTDLLEAAGATGKPVNIKKGQWMHPEGMRGAVEKVRMARESGVVNRESGIRSRKSGIGNQEAEYADAELQQQSEFGAQRNGPGDSRFPLPDSRFPTSEIAVTERGTFYGYGDLVVDMRSFMRMRAACEAPVIFDATHSVQRPGQGAGGSSGGAREYIPPLTLAAVAAGADALFLETHPDPANAPSDGPNMMPLDRLNDLVERAVETWSLSRG
ncbi:MAG: 3-deoxy-8-phosphooctulonate synthase [Anaerolineae bacterium]|nr:3-deoxy-8-phosphooctulonate synthase [Gemmatimonadaceae bacterium]